MISDSMRMIMAIGWMIAPLLGYIVGKYSAQNELKIKLLERKNAILKEFIKEIKDE